VDEHRDFKFGMQVDHSKSTPTDEKLFLKGARDLFKFWEITDNISEMVQDRHSYSERL